MERLIEHLLTWQYQPERRGSSWRRTIAAQREGIHLLLSKNPGFRPLLDEVVADAYQAAVRLVVATINCSRETFPETCPYSLEQLLDATFLP